MIIKSDFEIDPNCVYLYDGEYNPDGHHFTEFCFGCDWVVVYEGNNGEKRWFCLFDPKLQIRKSAEYIEKIDAILRESESKRETLFYELEDEIRHDEDVIMALKMAEE